MSPLEQDIYCTCGSLNFDRELSGNRGLDLGSFLRPYGSSFAVRRSWPAPTLELLRTGLRRDLCTYTWNSFKPRFWSSVVLIFRPTVSQVGPVRAIPVIQRRRRFRNSFCHACSHFPKEQANEQLAPKQTGNRRAEVWKIIRFHRGRRNERGNKSVYERSGHDDRYDDAFASLPRARSPGACSNLTARAQHNRKLICYWRSCSNKPSRNRVTTFVCMNITSARGNMLKHSPHLSSRNRSCRALPGRRTQGGLVNIRYLGACIFVRLSKQGFRILSATPRKGFRRNGHETNCPMPKRFIVRTLRDRYHPEP